MPNNFISKISGSWMMALAVALALFMDSLDATILNTAIPTMAHSLKIEPIDLKIALISYLLSLAIFIPISGWLGDRYGVKRVFILALGIFTLSSFWCGYSNSLVEIILARSCQGIGSALIMPLGRLIILRSFPRHQVIEVMNVVIMVVSLGLMLGPVAGGFITDHLSWHWIFWVNIPVGLLAIFIAAYWLKNTAPRKTPAFDFLGFLLFGSGLSGLLFSLSALSESTTDRHTAFLIMAIAVLLLIIYFLYSHKQKHPIINISLLNIRTFQASIMGNLLSRLGFSGLPFLLPLLLQIGLGYDAAMSGLLLAPMALGIIAGKIITTSLLRLIGYRRLLLSNTILVGLCLWTFFFIDAHISIYAIGFSTFIFGTLTTVQYTGMNSIAYAKISEEDLSSATSFISTTQQLAQSFGVAVAALLLTHYAHSINDKTSLTPVIFHKAFFAMGLITMLSAIIFLRLEIDDGQEMLKAKSN